jgi:hypothetical protein
MQFRVVALFGFVTIQGLAGCGSSSTAEKEDEASAERLRSRPMNTSYVPGSRRFAEEPETQSRAGEMQVEMEMGTVDQGDVEQAIERSWRTLTRCYSRAGEGQRYVDGQVMLRFALGGDGKVQDVLVIENGLGNYAVERCLVVEGRNIKFPKPEGGATTFDYPIQFRSTRELTVIDYPGESIASDLSEAMLDMDPCPTLGDKPVQAVAYIEPNGSVGSIGLASEGAIDPDAGICAVKQIHDWRLPGEPGHVLRTTFALRIPREKRVAPPEAPRPPAARNRRRR